MAQKSSYQILETLEKLFFALFLLSIPLQTRILFDSRENYLFGTFNEYATFSPYLSDIFLATTLLLFFVNRLTKRSKNGEIANILSTSPQVIHIFLTITLFVTWSSLSIIWAAYTDISLYRSIKILEMALLFYYLNRRLNWFGIKNLLSTIFLIGLAESIIGITQYILQRSIGLKFLGETILSPSIGGVAKIIVDNNRIIRAYGTFPHPNVFAAFLIFCIFIGLWMILTFRSSNKPKIVSRETIFIFLLTIGVVLQSATLILTFSRVAWLGIFLTILIIIFLSKPIKLFHSPTPKATKNKRLPAQASLSQSIACLKQNNAIVSRETIFRAAKAGETILNERRRVKQFYQDHTRKAQKLSLALIILSTLITISILWKPISARTVDNDHKYDQAISYRVLYNDIAINIIKQNPILGIGNGNFTLEMKNFSPTPLQPWQYQPTHNIYLLIASELGMIGLVTFLFFIFRVLKMAYLSQKNQIVSSSFAKTSEDKRLPAQASLSQSIACLKQNNAIVSRETIFRAAKAGETISEKANFNDTIIFKRILFAVFATFLVMGLFDHYFWTLQQGQLTFWLVLGILFTLNAQE